MKTMRYVLLLICLFVTSQNVIWAQAANQANDSKAQDANTSYLEEQKSPKDAMKFFLTAMDDAVKKKIDTAWERVRLSMDLSQANPDRLEAIANELWEVIDKIEWIDWDDTHLPGVYASMSFSSFTYFPDKRFEKKLGYLAKHGQIVLTKNNEGRWQFSAQTVANSHALNIAFEDVNVAEGVRKVAERDERNWIRKQIPKALKGIGHTILTLEYWQWISIFLIGLLGMVIDLAIRTLLSAISRKVIARYTSTEHAKSVGNAVRPVGLLGAAILWCAMPRLIQLPDMAFTVLISIAQVVGTFATVWAAWRMTDLISEVLMDKAIKTDNKFDDVLVPLIRKTVKVFIVAFGLIYGAHSLHIEVLPLITGLGIGGLAFAFAAKDTIENFFGSIAVILDRPFEVGDWVVIDGNEGTVIELGFRSTRIRTFYDSLITVPNAALVRATVDNYGRRRYRRWKTYIGIQYDTPPEKMQAFVEGIRQLVLDHPHTRKDYFHVYYNQFSSSSLDILLYVFHEVPDWSMELQERERLFIDIVKLASDLGVSFAFPTQTIHLAKDDPSPEITVNFTDMAKKQITKQQRGPEGEGRAFT